MEEVQQSLVPAVPHDLLPEVLGRAVVEPRVELVDHPAVGVDGVHADVVREEAGADQRREPGEREQRGAGRADAIGLLAHAVRAERGVPPFWRFTRRPAALLLRLESCPGCAKPSRASLPSFILLMLPGKLCTALDAVWGCDHQPRAVVGHWWVVLRSASFRTPAATGWLLRLLSRPSSALRAAAAAAEA